MLTVTPLSVFVPVPCSSPPDAVASVPPDTCAVDRLVTDPAPVARIVPAPVCDTPPLTCSAPPALDRSVPALASVVPSCATSVAPDWLPSTSPPAWFTTCSVPLPR